MTNMEDTESSETNVLSLCATQLFGMKKGRQFGALGVYAVISTEYGNGLQEMIASCHS